MYARHAWFGLGAYVKGTGYTSTYVHTYLQMADSPKSHRRINLGRELGVHESVARYWARPAGRGDDVGDMRCLLALFIFPRPVRHH
jgi:hypothetical protein